MTEKGRMQQRVAEEVPCASARTATRGETAPASRRAQPYGNQAALRALGNLPVQPKLRVNAPGDEYEREADAAADAVLRSPEHGEPPPTARSLTRVSQAAVGAARRAADDEEEVQCKEDEDDSHRRGEAKKREEEEDRPVQRKAVHDGTAAPSQAESRIEATRGGGSALPAVTRQFFEPRFGRKLSDVRVHTDASADASARDLGAHAFTTGRDLYFASGRYDPGSTAGRSLLAHELAHTIQQRGGESSTPIVARQADSAATMPPPASAPSAPTTTAPGGTPPGLTKVAGEEKLPADVPAEEVELMGKGTFEPSPAVAGYVEGKGAPGAPVRVRFGTLAAGSINVKQKDGTYFTQPDGRKLQGIALAHPFLEPLRQRGIIQPVLAVRMERSQITGYLTIAGPRGPLDYKAVTKVIAENAEALGWLGLDDIRIPDPVNTLEGGKLAFEVPNFTFRLGGYLRGSGEIGLSNDVVTFVASAAIKVKKGVADAKLKVERNAAGQLFGKAELPVKFVNFSGNLIAELGNGTFRIDGLVKYQSEKFDGEVKLIVTDEQEARNIARTKLPPEKILASAEEAEGKPAKGKGPKPGPRAIAGWGTITFRLTEWLAGQATVIIDSEGNITVVGEIAPPAEVELFKQRDYIKPLPKFEARAAYGIPIVGNIFVFANIGFEALAKLGPGKIYQIKIAGTYSTDPAVLQDFSIEGTLNISAFAGLRVRGEGGAGLEILDHDIKAGVGVSALAGVRGYVEATPKIGYREKADPQLGKKGEAYLHGHMEIAAQPFLGLGGDLFVELDSPWWSPAPDKKWTWPLGELEYPLPGEFGIGADIDYLIGSGELPEVQFGEVNFSADKFMTDLMNDHVPPKAEGEKEKQGEWKEGEIAGGGEKDPTVAATGEKPPAGEVATGQQQAVPGQEPSSAPPGTADPALVKEAALSEAESRLTGEDLQSMDQLEGVVADIYGKRSSEGLESLTIHVADESSLDFEVIAAASEPERRTIKWRDAFAPNDRAKASFATQKGFETFAAISVNGKRIGSVTRSDDEGHAEENLLRAHWNKALELARANRDQGERSTIVVAINRAPCHTICAPKLIEVMESVPDDLKETTDFILAPTGVYEPTEILTEDVIAEDEARYEEIAETLRAAGQDIPGYKVVSRASFKEATTRMDDLEALVEAGWDIRQLSARPKPTTAGLILGEVAHKLAVRANRVKAGG